MSAGISEGETRWAVTPSGRLRARVGSIALAEAGLDKREVRVRRREKEVVGFIVGVVGLEMVDWKGELKGG